MRISINGNIEGDRVQPDEQKRYRLTEQIMFAKREERWDRNNKLTVRLSEFNTWDG